LNSKALLQTLSGATSTGSSTTVTNITTNITAIASTDIPITNYVALNLAATNFSTNIFGTNGALVASNFPATITVTNVIVTVGTNSSTNTVLLTESSSSPPTYTFNNSVTVAATNGYIFTNTYVITNGTGTNATFTTNPAPYLTAVLLTTNNTPSNQLVFSFEYSTLVITTNITAGTNGVVTFPTFSSKDKLVLVTPLAGPSGPTNPPTFAVQEGTGKNITLVDVSAFIFFTADSDVTDVTIKGVDYNLWTLNIAATTSSGLFTAHDTALIKETFGVKVKNVSYPSLPKNLEADTEGSGSFAGNALILQGKITASGGSTGPALTSP